MAPLLSTFPASELPLHTQTSIKGPSPRKRKGWDGDLKACELFEMMQYRCEGDDDGNGGGKDVRRWKKDGVVRCWEVERLFRRCKDREGTFMVETTAWEGRDGKKLNG